MPWVGEKKTSALVARDVPPEMSHEQTETEVPFGKWSSDQLMLGYVKKFLVKGSGAGFVAPPYITFWERIWGATPIEDLPAYKSLYTFTPYIKAAVDVTVNMTLSNGFELKGGKDDVREWLENWLDEQNILQSLRIEYTDMLVSGNGYLELCGFRDGFEPEDWWLKPLDPVYMRVRRDAFGNVFGYIQLLTFPPVAFENEEIVHFKSGAKSWQYEFSYGTSLLRPLILIESLIDDFQSDMAIIMKVYTKPMLDIACGTPERPFNDAQLAAVVNAFQSRGPATDVFHRGDITVKGIQSFTREINVQWWLDYLHKQREAVLGVPKIFMGETERTNRATADVVMQEYVTRLRMHQQEIGDTLETVLFKRIIEKKFGEGVEIPEVSWNPIWEPLWQDKADAMVKLAGATIIDPQEARLPLGFEEDMPTEQDQGIREGTQKPSAGTAAMRANKGKWLITKLE